MIGSVIFTFLNAFVTGFTEYWPLVSGVVIIIVVLAMPGGLFGILKKKGYFSSKKAGDMKNE